MVAPHAHLPLVSALTTLYSLLVDLRHVPANKLLRPSSAYSGPDGLPQQPPHSINAAAARAHGFSDAAVDLAYHIPYLTDDYVYIFMETQAVSYLRGSVATALEEDPKADLSGLKEVDDPLGEGMDGWDYARDPTYQERTDLWDGRDVLVLTQGHVYGTELVYDLEAQTITEWYHFRVEHDDFGAVPAYSMTDRDNPLYVWIRNLLSLRNLALENHIVPPLEWPDPELAHPWHKLPAVQKWEWKEMVRDYEAKRALAGVYLEFGWDARVLDDDAFPQDDESREAEGPIWEQLERARQWATQHFRGDEFEAYRATWLEEMHARRERERAKSKALFEATQGDDNNGNGDYDNEHQDEHDEL